MRKQCEQLHKPCIEQRLDSMCSSCQEKLRAARHEIKETVASAARALPRLFAGRKSMVILMFKAEDDEDAIVLLTPSMGLDLPARATFRLLQEKVAIHQPACQLARAVRSRAAEIVDWLVIAKPSQPEVTAARAYLQERFGPAFIEELEQSLDELAPFGIIEPRRNN